MNSNLETQAIPPIRVGCCERLLLSDESREFYAVDEEEAAQRGEAILVLGAAEPGVVHYAAGARRR